jgi:hypothetical protein
MFVPYDMNVIEHYCIMRLDQVDCVTWCEVLSMIQHDGTLGVMNVKFAGNRAICSLSETTMKNLQLDRIRYAPHVIPGHLPTRIERAI